MATSHYVVTVDGEERFRFSADFANGCAPLLMDGGSTPYCVGHVGHSPGRAAGMLVEWGRNVGRPAVAADEDWEWDDAP